MEICKPGRSSRVAQIIAVAKGTLSVVRSLKNMRAAYLLEHRPELLAAWRVADEADPGLVEACVIEMCQLLQYSHRVFETDALELLCEVSGNIPKDALARACEGRQSAAIRFLLRAREPAFYDTSFTDYAGRPDYMLQDCFDLNGQPLSRQQAAILYAMEDQVTSQLEKHLAITKGAMIQSLSALQCGSTQWLLEELVGSADFLNQGVHPGVLGLIAAYHDDSEDLFDCVLEQVRACVLEQVREVWTSKDWFAPEPEYLAPKLLEIGGRGLGEAQRRDSDELNAKEYLESLKAEERAHKKAAKKAKKYGHTEQAGIQHSFSKGRKGGH